MAWELWLAFIGAAVLIAVSPGAGAIQSMATGLTHGVRRGYWSILGLEIGLMLQLALVALGLGAIVTGSIVAFNVVKWVGVAYLLYLAVRQWRTATRDLKEQLDTSTDGGRAALVLRGFLVNFAYGTGPLAANQATLAGSIEDAATTATWNFNRP